MRKFLHLPLFLTIILNLFCLKNLAFAQRQEELILTFSRDFGYASGTGDIQGTFSMKVSGPPDLQKVVFLIDGKPIGEDNEPPFRIQFTTDAFPLGKHTLSAIGITANGTELYSKEYTRNFVSAEEGWKAAMKIAGPLLAMALIVSVLSFIFPFLSLRKKAGTVPLGAPRRYGLVGGAICPKCHRPFPMHLFSPNLLVGKLERCPYCGKWSVVSRASLTELKEAEASELELSAETAQVQGETEEERLRKELEDSRYQNY